MVPPMPMTARTSGTKATSTLNAIAPAMKKMRSSPAFSMMRRANFAAEARAGRTRGGAGRGPAEGAAGGESTRCAAGGPSAEGRSSSAMYAKVSALRAQGQAQEADQRREAECGGEAERQDA